MMDVLDKHSVGQIGMGRNQYFGGGWVGPHPYVGSYPRQV